MARGYECDNKNRHNIGPDAGGCPVTELEQERRLTAVEDRAKSNSHRIEKLEASTAAIHRLAASMEVMAEKQDRVADTVDKLDCKVTALEGRPGRRWDGLVDKAMLTAAAALVGFVLVRLGIG